MTVDGSNLVYIEACEGGRLIHDAADVRSFELRFDRIGAEALSPSSYRSLIETALEGFDGPRLAEVEP